MQCLAGLWWDQQRRSCVLPSEVACNPYNIINSQGQGQFPDPNPTGNIEIDDKYLTNEQSCFFFFYSYLSTSTSSTTGHLSIH